MEAGTSFCVHCGAQAGDRTATGTAGLAAGLTPWRLVILLTAVAGVAVIWVMTRPGVTAGPVSAPGQVAAAPGAAPGAPPDISKMTPREQFARLADLIETAMAAGDSAKVVRFFPMAESAFATLTDSTRDNDARFHMGLLQVRVGHAPAALAQADSMTKGAPSHLLASYVRAIVGDIQNDPTAAKKARQAFREHFAAEVALNRPEYQMHREMLDQFLATIPVGGAPR